MLTSTSNTWSCRDHQGRSASRSSSTPPLLDTSSTRYRRVLTRLVPLRRGGGLRSGRRWGDNSSYIGIAGNRDRLRGPATVRRRGRCAGSPRSTRSEEHTSELQSPTNLVCRLLLEKK